MLKLLYSGFQRLFKNKLLLICSAVVFALSLFAGGQIVRSSQKIYVDAQYFMEDTLFVTLPYMAFYCATFVSLFLGIEYEQGTIRNKLLVGHTRATMRNHSMSITMRSRFVPNLLQSILSLHTRPGIVRWLIVHILSCSVWITNQEEPTQL